MKSERSRKEITDLQLGRLETHMGRGPGLILPDSHQDEDPEHLHQFLRYVMSMIQRSNVWKTYLQFSIRLLVVAEVERDYGWEGDQFERLPMRVDSASLGMTLRLWIQLIP